MSILHTHLSVKTFGSILVFLLINCFVWISCQKINNPVFSGEPIFIEENFIPKYKILDWKDGKKAAYSLTFDDARESHYQIAWPEMKSRGINGTFFINTPADLNWIPWRYLHKFGNEIGSHTFNHVDLTTLNPERIETELIESFEAIWTNIGKIPKSFSNPFGTTNALVESIIKKYYSSARNQFGINSVRLEEDDFFHLCAIGVYPQITRKFLLLQLKKTIRENGYIIVNFHSLNPENTFLSEPTYMPLSFFQDHLNDVLAYSDDLWIATQRDVVDYIRSRNNAKIEVEVKKTELQFELNSKKTENKISSPLSIKVHWPKNWRRKSIFAKSKQFSFPVFSDIDSISNINIFPNKKMVFCAYKK